MSIEFFQTGMGHRYYEGTMPKIARALTQIAETLPQLVPAAAPKPTAEKCDFKSPLIEGDEVVCPGCSARDDIVYYYDSPNLCDVEVRDGELVAARDRNRDGENSNESMYCRRCGATFSEVGIDTE